MSFLCSMNIAIIGGGAAGFFAAIAAKENHADAKVTVFEKSNKILSKVKVSGGGRCNVTNGSSSQKELLTGYPRGDKLLKKAFRIFDNQCTQSWFHDKGVSLKKEADLRVFPTTDDSLTIVNCLLDTTRRMGIGIEKNTCVESIKLSNDTIELKVNDEINVFDKVIIATGGSPKLGGLTWLKDLGHKIEPPVPSLFTFNMPKERITSLMGIAVDKATVRVQATKLISSGPLLITHWGMSGPAVLKLSSFGARQLHDLDYQFNIQVNWSNISNQEEALAQLEKIASKHPAKKLASIRPFNLPERLWLFLLDKIDLANSKPWAELGKKGLNKLVNGLCNDIYVVSGKTTFKEEFVTCGGVSLDSIDHKTMQSKVCPHLYFAGEILDIDGITGGYNFQAAWTTAYIAGKLK